MRKRHVSSLRLILTATLAVVLILALNRFQLNDLLTFESLKQHHHSLQEFARTERALALGAYLGVYILVTALSLPGATLLTLAGGAVFGLVWGTIAVSIASTLG